MSPANTKWMVESSVPSAPAPSSPMSCPLPAVPKPFSRESPAVPGPCPSPASAGCPSDAGFHGPLLSQGSFPPRFPCRLSPSSGLPSARPPCPDPPGTPISGALSLKAPISSAFTYLSCTVLHTRYPVIPASMIPRIITAVSIMFLLSIQNLLR